MKKIIVLTMLVLLAIGMPVVAVDFGGDFTIKSGSNFKEGYVPEFDLSLDVSQAVDDYNTVSFELEIDALMKDYPPPSAAVVDNPKLTTDIGAALGLPDVVGVVVSSGIFEGETPNFLNLTGYEVERITKLEPEYYGGAEVVFTFAELVSVELGTAFDGANKSWMAGAFGTFGPVSAELYYACLDDALADGQLIVDAVFSQELGILALDAGAGFRYDLAGDEDATPATREWAYGVGVAVTADVGISVGGGIGLMGTSQEDHILEAVGIDLSVDPLEDLGIDIGIYLNTYTKASGDDTPMLDHIDFSLYKNFGAAEYRVGYLYAGDEPAKYAAGTGTEELNAPMTATGIDGGGFYIAVDINY